MDCSREVPVVSGNTTQKHNSVKKDELGGGGCQKRITEIVACSIVSSRQLKYHDLNDRRQ